MKKFLLTLILTTTFLSLSAQEKGKVRDMMEVAVDSVVVSDKRPGRSDDVTVGTRVSSISAQVLEGNRTKSLSELLSENTMVYIKSLGQGALATSSFRGTSSSHTQVNWNGININPTMSSSFDFSQIPVFFADNVTLYHGNSHLKNGTGALGGSINISNVPQWDDSTRLRSFVEMGAYETYTGAAAARFLREKSLYQTRVYYQQSENNFRYLNKVLSKDPFYERRKEGQYKQAGIMQEAYFRPSKYATISTNLWFQYGNRRLPQPVIVNVVEHEKQKDYGIKYFLGYNYAKKQHEFSVKTAYTLDFLDYTKWFDSDFFHDSEDSFNRSQSVHLIGDYTYRPSQKLSFNTSLRYTYDLVHASSYSKGDVSRNVLALQASALWQATNRITLNAQIMGELNDKETAPTFSVGAVAQVARDFALKGNISYNYKFPSLNDLYWQPGGNADLLPEKGFTYDLTATYTPKINDWLYFKTEATYYLMNIDNWIMWLPTQNWYWEPRNVQNVLSHGLELLTEWNFVVNPAFRAKLGINYTYSPSINRQRNFEEDNTYKKQLPYIPKHKANARLAIDYKNLFFTYQVCYTGIRYTTQDESYQTNAYTIHDTEIGYNWRIKGKYTLTPKISIDNLFDAYYESTQYYPMPLRNIAGSITFTF